MNTTLRRDADEIICSSIQAVLPDKAVCRALEDFQPGGGRVLLVAAGKAAWQMAHDAVQALGRVDGGVVVTKYGHKSELHFFRTSEIRYLHLLLHALSAFCIYQKLPE